MKKSQFLTKSESQQLLKQLQPITKTSADTRSRNWVSHSKPTPVSRGTRAAPTPKPKKSIYPPPTPKQINYAKQLGLNPKEFNDISPKARYWSIYLSEPWYRDRRTPKELKEADARIKRNGIAIKPFVYKGKTYKRY